jgi:hypothetical protein
MTDKAQQPEVRVGSYLLDTLTVGMYENPLHCLREYVQNAFDALNDAVEQGVLTKDKASLVMKVSSPGKKATLSLRDNGIGVAAENVYDKLVSIGNSRKNQTKHAGFRGIGRLAGIAYCNTLRFTTKAAGEAVASVVEIDCPKMRGLIAAGSTPTPLQEVMRSCVTVTSHSASASEHYTEVELIGLYGQGHDFTDIDRVETYLGQYAPVDYGSSFSQADEVYKQASKHGIEVPTLTLLLKQGRDERNVRKRFTGRLVASDKSSAITGIQSVASKEHGWFAWFAEAEYLGEISDSSVAGLRFRQRNIQVGTSSLIERIASEMDSPSNRRLMRWVVGEVFVVSPKVVPNARRDGFEDNDAWRDIERDMTSVISTISSRVRQSSNRRSAVERVKRTVSNRREEIEGRDAITREDRARFDADLEQQLNLIIKAGKKGADPDRLDELVASIKELREKLRGLPLAPATLGPLLARVLEIVREEVSKEATAVVTRKVCARIQKRLNALE